MQIRRIKLDNYGPLRDVDWDLEPGMTLFYGPNESGKTLLVESIIKLLLGDGATDIDQIDRVTGHPAGFLVIESDGNTVQVPDASFPELFPPETDRADLRNAFIIRDFDLRRPGRQPDFGRSAYLRDVSDRIMGSQTQRIERINEEIAELGHLANAGSDRLMNRQPEKLKTRRDDAVELVEELDGYLTEAREDGILETARRKRKLKREREQVTEELATLRAAEEYAQLETGRELVKNLRAIEAELASHEAEGEQVETYESVLDTIDAYRDADGETIHPQTYLRAVFVLVPLLALALVGSIGSYLWDMGASASLLLPLIAGLLLLALFYTGYKYVAARKHVVTGQNLVETANYAGIPGDDLPTVYTQLEETVAAYQDDAAALSSKRLRTLGQLEGVFGVDLDSVEEWEDALDTRAEDVTPVDRSYDEEEFERLTARREQLETDIATARRDLNQHRELLSYYDGKIRDIQPAAALSDVEEVRIQSIEDIPAAIKTLQQFIETLNARRDVARTAIDIFSELADAERREINRLFQEEDFIVQTFKDVTDENYVDVWYDEALGVQLERADGRTWAPHALSQGTYDLLYLIVRLQLAQALLNDEPGFLILDDAFIHSDATRTRREIAMLEQLVEEGWQVIYVSVREAVRNAIESTDNARVIQMQPLEFRA